MAMRLRISGETLRLTGDAVASPIIPIDPAILLANEAGETLLADNGDFVAMETPDDE